MRKIKVRFEPFGITVYVKKGSSILEAAQEAGVHINASCGGEGVCGKCRVRIDEGIVQGGLIDKSKIVIATQDVRQACLATLVEDVVISIDIEPMLDKTAFKALITGISQPAIFIDGNYLKKEGRFKPALAKVVVKVQPPTRDDNRNDVHRLLYGLREVGEKGFVFEFETIRDLPKAWRQGNWQVTTTIMRPAGRKGGRNQVIRVEPGNTSSQNLAVAIDLGTTTIWAQVVDLHTGQVLGTEGDFNSQANYGEDIISRIIYAGKPGGLKYLQRAAANSINKILELLAQHTGVNLHNISLVTLAGNTSMTQIFLEIDPNYIRLEPYVPAAAYYPPVKACDFGLNFDDHTHLLLFPSVASFVGGDIVSGIMGVGLHKDPQLTLFIDLGTNGEVVIGNKDWIACAAASAGPAFEGGGIKFGMRAASGAIENFSILSASGEPSIITIGYAKAKGICGSGLIAIVAGLLLAGLIDERGHLNLNYPSPRLRDGEDGPEYVIVWAADSQINRDITISEIDIEHFIRAKGAIYAAYMTLLEGVGLTVHDLERVILAGGFGQTINLEHAILIGLLPELPLKRFTFIGNGSLLGARLIVLSNYLRAEVGDIVDKMTNFELSIIPSYISNYTSSLFLPHTEAKILFPQAWNKLQELRHILSKN